MNHYRTLTKDFPLEIDKNRVLAAIGCKEGGPTYQKVNSLYERLLEIFKNTISPMGVFEFHKNIETVDLDILKDTKILVYNFITLGQGVSIKTEQFFSGGNYLEALIFDAMGSELLFNMGEEIYKDICTQAKELGLSLNKRISPGDDDIPLYYQGLIWEKLNLEELGVVINEAYVFQPLKSIGFIYGTTDWDENTRISHQCETCKNLKCNMRKTNI